MPRVCLLREPTYVNGSDSVKWRTEPAALTEGKRSNDAVHARLWAVPCNSLLGLHRPWGWMVANCFRYMPCSGPFRPAEWPDSGK